MTLKTGKTYRIHWIDAAESSNWSSEQDLDKFIVECEAGVEQILTFIKESNHFYAFTTGKHLGDNNHADIMLIPKKWTISIKQLRI